MSKQRVFLTGASGYIGSAVARHLVAAGHEVHGMTRSRSHARALEAIGVKPVIADLADIPTYLGVLQNCDSVIHTAADMQNGTVKHDLAAIEAFRQASADGRVRRILYTSGVWVHGPSVDAIDEHAPYQPLDIVGWRPVHETLAYELSEHEVAVTIIRPGMVYGEHRGILGMWFAEAHDKKTLTYPGDGSQHWPLVHRDDLADLYVRALTGAKGGDAYLAGDGSWFTVKAMAEAVAAATGVTATSWPAEELLKAFGPFGQALLQDQRIQSTKAHTELGWTPTHTSFVDEADALWREWQESREATHA